MGEYLTRSISLDWLRPLSKAIIAVSRKTKIKKFRVLPGFRMTLGYTLFYLSLIVLIPLAAVFWKTSTLSWAEFWRVATSPLALASYRLSFGASFCAALVNTVFGLVVAWFLVRYRFLGKKIVDALVDLPFADSRAGDCCRLHLVFIFRLRRRSASLCLVTRAARPHTRLAAFPPALAA
jgi:ABC-type sulfate transport system permease subunit